MTIQRVRQYDQPVSQQRPSDSISARLPSRQENNGGSWYRPTEVQESQLANVLGWFSIGLGLAQVVAPESVARWIGVGDGNNRTTLQVVGMREIISGVGILTQPRPTGWLWARVGGDVMDLALLGGALNSDKAQRDRVALAAAAVVGITLLDLLGSRQFSQQPNLRRAALMRGGAIHVRKAITINRSPAEVYQYWHNFENLPRFMNHLESVQVMDERRSYWKAQAPAGTTVEWDAEIIDDRPDELISWRSLPGADVDNSGTVRFRPAPAGRGTEVYVELHYSPPGGVIGATVAKLFGEAPEQQVAEDLHRFKQVMEIGEVLQSDASIHRLPHPARPPAHHQ